MKTALFLLLPASALLYAPLAFEEFETPKAFALVAFGCFGLFQIKFKDLFKDRIAQALLLFTASAGISTILSIDQHMSIYGNPKSPGGLLVIASFAVAYIVMTQVLNSYSAKRDAIRIVLASSAVMAIYAIAQVLGFDFQNWTGTLKDYGYIRPLSLAGHPNFMAGYLAMTLPFAVWRSDMCQTKLESYLCKGLCLVSGIAIFLSQSRGMWLAAGLGLVIYHIVCRSYKRLIRAGVIAAIIGSACVSLSPGIRAMATERIEHILIPEQARFEYWKGALRIWDKHRIFGIGTDAFEIGYQNQRTVDYWDMEPGGSPHKAHNDFMNILATQGLAGALAAIILTLAVIDRIRRSKSIFYAPAVAATGAFYIEGLSSFMVVCTGVVFIFSLTLLKDELCGS